MRKYGDTGGASSRTRQTSTTSHWPRRDDHAVAPSPKKRKVATPKDKKIISAKNEEPKQPHTPNLVAPKVPKKSAKTDPKLKPHTQGSFRHIIQNQSRGNKGADETPTENVVVRHPSSVTAPDGGCKILTSTTSLNTQLVDSSLERLNAEFARRARGEVKDDLGALWEHTFGGHSKAERCCVLLEWCGLGKLICF